MCAADPGVKDLPQPQVGAEVDNRENLQGAQFVVNNPNAASTCGCGNSFAI